MQMNFGNALGTNNFSYLLRYFMDHPSPYRLFPQLVIAAESVDQIAKTPIT
jgi:hypothetical protein